MRSISQSEIRSWLDCRRKHRFGYIEKLYQKERPLALAYGTAFHTAMARYYTMGPSSLEKLRGYVLDTAGMLDPENIVAEREEDGETIEYPADWVEKQAHVPGMLRGQLRAFMDLRPNGPQGEFGGMSYIEHRIEVQHTHEVSFNGRLDGLGQDVHGNWWLLEHKTAAQIDASTILNLWTDLQISLYLWLCRRIREKGGMVRCSDDAEPYFLPAGEFPEVVGVLYNVARKPGLRPKKVRIGNWAHRDFAGESQAKIMAIIEDTAAEKGFPAPRKADVVWSERQESVAEYEERVWATIMENPSSYFVREYVQRTVAEDMEFEANLEAICSEMIHGAEYANQQHCPNCWYRAICMAPEESREATVDALFGRSSA